MTALTSHLKLLEAESIHIFREAAAQFRVTVPAAARPADVALAAEPAIGRPCQRALSTTLDNPPAYRQRHCLSYCNVRDHKVARILLRKDPA